MQDNDNEVLNDNDMTVAQKIYHMIPMLNASESEALRNELYYHSSRLQKRAQDKIMAFGSIDKILLT